MKKTLLGMALSMITATSTHAFEEYQEHLVLGKSAKYHLAGMMLAFHEMGGKYCQDTLALAPLNHDYVQGLLLAAKKDQPMLYVMLGSYERTKLDPHYVFGGGYACKMAQASAANFDIVKQIPFTEEERETLKLIGALDNTNCDIPKARLWKYLASPTYRYLSLTRESGLDVYTNSVDNALDVPCEDLMAFGEKLEIPE